MSEAESFAVDRVVRGTSRLGCLLIHGLTGTPAEMVPVAETLAGRYPLWVTRVAGHTTTVADLASTSWRDWHRSATAGADALLEVVPRIAVVGLSMGALLAIRLAVERPAAVAGLVLLSPAVAVSRGAVRRLRHPLTLLATLESRYGPLRTVLARVTFDKRGSDIADLEVRARHPSYGRIPLRAVLNLLTLQRRAARDAPAITQPTLVVHALHDHSCPVAASRDFYERLGARDKRLVLLSDSFHVVTVDRERDRVAREIGEFLARVAAPIDCKPAMP